MQELDASLPEGLLAAIHPDIAKARAFVRSTHRRIRQLTRQLCALVDAHASSTTQVGQSGASA